MQPQQIQDSSIMQSGQPSQQDLVQKTNQAKASLGNATNLMTQMLQHQIPQAPQKSETAPGSTQEPKQDNSTEDKKEPNIAEELTKFKTEIEGMLDSKLGDLKREIETELSKEDEQENKISETA